METTQSLESLPIIAPGVLVSDPPLAKSTTDTDTHFLSYALPHFWLYGQKKSFITSQNHLICDSLQVDVS